MRYLWVLLIPFLFVFVILYFQLVVGRGEDFAHSVAITGAFGDSFGMLTALFAGYAAFQVRQTLIIQDKILKETREDLELNRNELVASQRQQRVIALESSFYHMVDLLNERKDGVTIWSNSRDENVGGETALTIIYSQIEKKYQELLFAELSPDIRLPTKSYSIDYFAAFELLEDEAKHNLVIAFKKYLKENFVEELGAYFSLLSTLVDFVEDHTVELPNDGSLLRKVLTAQLSVNTLKILATYSVIFHKNPPVKRTSFVLKRMNNVSAFYLFDYKYAESV
ncbi:hypothetical protein [Thiomicrorhabdus sediminis]|uniref:Phage abortive infection protein n=1 Tax=Thiomicrorhabdus sediminis TaxID=2580412 RepID=A0A4P9K654_9GAMM|nr:hypothetical protein [Thiomicrorhabdus sediminis]QCU90544.1 hypothetical protein FE785_07810 [Thiomicrorhabdus sediminis]